MDCPVEVLIQRDVKGLYKKALSGEIGHFSGISDLYEPPLAPEVTIDSSSELPEPSAERILCRLVELGIIPLTGTGLLTTQGKTNSIRRTGDGLPNASE